MENFKTRSTTRTMGESQGYMPLHVADFNHEQGEAMASFWKPSEIELQRLNNGEPIHLIVLGSQHPPVVVGVGRMPGDLDG